MQDLVGKGAVVTGGFLSDPGLGLYCTTKFAVVGFSDALRAELAPHGIGVATLCPGGVRTNLLAAFDA